MITSYLVINMRENQDFTWEEMNPQTEPRTVIKGLDEIREFLMKGKGK
jgi:hypothetical protein